MESSFFSRPVLHKENVLLNLVNFVGFQPPGGSQHEKLDVFWIMMQLDVIELRKNLQIVQLSFFAVTFKQVFVICHGVCYDIVVYRFYQGVVAFGILA